MQDPRVTPSAIDKGLMVLGGVLALWALACVVPVCAPSNCCSEITRRFAEDDRRAAKLLEPPIDPRAIAAALPTVVRYQNALALLEALENRARHDEEVVPLLLGAHDPALENIYVFEPIVDTLGEIGDPRCGPALLTALRNAIAANDLRRYRSHVRALGLVGHAAAADTLHELLRSQLDDRGQERMRAECLLALGRLGDPRAFDVALLQSERRLESDTHDAAIRYLVLLGTEESHRHLKQVYSERQEPGIALALLQLGDHDVLPGIRAEMSTWLDRYDSTGWNDPGPLSYFAQAILIGRDPVDRAAACRLQDVLATNLEYVETARREHAARLLLDESRAETLLEDLARFARAP